MNVNMGGFGNVTLVADSHFNMRNTTFQNPLDPAAKVDLGGYTLTVDLRAGSGANLYMPVSVENGNMAIASGGYLALNSGTVGGSSSLNLEMTGAAFKTDGDFSVSNYVARYSSVHLDYMAGIPSARDVLRVRIPLDIYKRKQLFSFYYSAFSL